MILRLVLAFLAFQQTVKISESSLLTWQGVKIKPSRVPSNSSRDLDNVCCTIQVGVRQHTCRLLLVLVDQQHQGVVWPERTLFGNVLRHLELVADLALEQNRGELVANWKTVPVLNVSPQFGQTGGKSTIGNQSRGRPFAQMNWMGNQLRWSWSWKDLERMKPWLRLQTLSFQQLAKSTAVTVDETVLGLVGVVAQVDPIVLHHLLHLPLG